MKFPVPLWLLFTLLPFSAFAQKGVILYKDAPWDADQFVTATPYKEVDKFSTVHNITPMTGAKVRVSSALVVKNIVFPTPASLTDLTEEPQVKALEAMIADWTATMGHFPTSAKHLKPHIAQLQAEVAQFHTGKVKSGGVWMTKEAFVAKQKKAAEEKRKAMAKLEAEAQQLGVLVQEWAGLDEAGRQRLRDEKARKEEAQMRAAEELRLKQEIEKQEKLAAERAKMKPVERLATDTWVNPPGLKEDQAKEYEETLKLVREQLAKAQEDIGFGKETQRMVLKTPERIYVFRPMDLSPEVQVVQSEEKEKGATITLETTERKEVIEAFPKDGSNKAMTSSAMIPVSAAVDVEKVKQGLSQLITICGGKKVPEKAPEQK